MTPLPVSVRTDSLAESPGSSEPLSEFSNPNDDHCQLVDAFAVVDGEAN